MAFAQFCFFTSLIFLKFATATSLTLLTPFIVAIFSIPILGTKIDFWKWIAIIIGFSGAIVIISPSNEIFSIYALLPLGASFGYGMNLVLVRLFPKDIPTIIIQWHSQISSIFFSLLFLLLTFQYVEILNKLRKVNISSEIYPGEGKLKKQMEYANKIESPGVIFYGDDEIKKAEVKFRNLKTGEETSIKIENIENEIKKFI